MFLRKISIILILISLVSCESKEDKEFLDMSISTVANIITKKWCAAQSCAQFNGEIVGEGKSHGVDSKIMKLKFVRVLPERHQDVCIYVHFTYDKHTAMYERIVYSKEYLSGGHAPFECSLDSKIVGGKTFKEYLSTKLGYKGSWP